MSVLIHIGYPRAGSTYLQTWFSQHPSFYYNQNSIAGFYDLLEMAKYAQTNSKIHEYFVVSCEDLSIWKGGDLDNLGQTYVPYDIINYQKKISTTLFEIFPQGKVLIVTRGFVSIITSIYSLYVISGGVLTFDNFQKEYRGLFKLFCDYTRVITLYKELFGPQNLIVLPYELLNENPPQFISLIEEKLGLNEAIKFTEEKINASVSDYQLVAHLKTSIFLKSITTPLPYFIQKKIQSFYANLLNKKKLNPLMNFLSKLVVNKIDIEIHKETLELLSGNADIFKDDPLFESYIREYLITN